MASTVPIAGSAYTYAYATMGEFIAWLIGWDLILEYMVGATTVAIGWSGYVASFLHDWGIDIPAQFTVSRPARSMIEIPDDVADKLHMRHGWSAADRRRARVARRRTRSTSRRFPQVTAIFNVPAMLIVALVTALLVVGIQESARVNNVIVVDQGRDRASSSSSSGLRLRHAPTTGAARSSRRGRPLVRVRQVRLERHLPRGRAWSSSPTSASTPSRRPPRRPRTPSATCRSASSARW